MNEVGWIPVSVSLPPNDTVVVLLTEDRYTGTGIWHNDSWRTNDAYVEYEPITHWCKLPDLPEVEE